MKNRHLSRLVVLGSLVIAGLLAVQVTWLKRAFDIHQKEFNHTVQIALQQVADSILQQEVGHHDLAKVKQLSSKFYFAQLNSRIDPQKLDTLLKKEFALRQLDLTYEFGIYNAYDDTLVYGAYVPATIQWQIDHAGDEDKDNLPASNFAVYFPTKTGYLAGEMKIWIFTTFMLLLAVFFFVYALTVLLKEKKLSEIKADFINNLTHEFKTPIANIELAGEVLNQKRHQLDDRKRAQYTKIIQQENQRLKMQVEQILNVGAMDSQNLVLNKKPADIHYLLQAIAQSMEMKLKSRMGKLHFDLKASITHLSVDAVHLGNALLNVLDNAEKYSPNSPDITISTQDEKHGLRISVADKGRGIRKDLQRFVFDKFFRVPQGEQHDVKGFGLGLSYVKSVVKAHHGKVLMKSVLGLGTQLDIFLPYE